MRHIIPALFGTLSLMAAPPEPFSVLDMEAGARKPVKTTVQTVDYFVNVPTAIKKKTPFLPGAWNYNAIVDLHGRLQTEDPFPLEKLTMLIPKGEYGFKTFLLRTYAPIKDISLKADALRNNQGNIIRKENILIVRIAESIDYPAANILIPAEMKNIPDKTLAGFAILVNIPEDVPAGNLQHTSYNHGRRSVKTAAFKCPRSGFQTAGNRYSNGLLYSILCIRSRRERRAMGGKGLYGDPAKQLLQVLCDTRIKFTDNISLLPGIQIPGQPGNGFPHTGSSG